jgi:hypothetical protein
MDDEDDDIVFVMVLVMNGPDKVSVPTVIVSACDELLLEMLMPMIVCDKVVLLPETEGFVLVLGAEIEEASPVELRVEGTRDALDNMAALEEKLEDVALPAEGVDVTFPVAEAVVDNVPSMPVVENE